MIKGVEIEEILKNVDIVAGENNNQSNISNSNQDFNRETVKNYLDEIKQKLQSKTQIIKNLKYSLALAKKVLVYFL